MRRIIGKWWAKVIALVLCIVSILTGAVSFAAMIYEAQVPKGELLNKVYKKIADNYSAKILADYGDSSDEAEFQKKVETDIDPQLRFAIVKKNADYWFQDPYTMAIEIDAYGEETEYLYGSAEDVKKADYWMKGGEGFYSYYSTTSLPKMMECGYTIDSTDMYLKYEEVYEVVYDAKNNLFYYKTESGYYPAHSIVVTQNGEEKIYVLTEEASEKESIEIAVTGGADGEMEDADGEETFVTDAAGETARTDAAGVTDADLFYISEDGQKLSPLEPGSEVQMENNTCVIRVLTENDSLLSESPGSYVRYVENMDLLADAEVHGYEDTYIEDSWIVHRDNSDRAYYYIFSYVDETVANDGFPGFFAEARTWVERWERIASHAIPVEILSILVFFAAFVFLMWAAGHRGAGAESDGEEIRLYAPDTIWFEVTTGVAFLAELGIAWLMYCLLGVGTFTVAGLLTVELELASAFCLVILLYLVTIAARIKAKKFWRYTCVYWCWKACVKFIRKGWGMLCQFWNKVPARFFRWLVERQKAYKEFARTHHSIVRRTVGLLLVLTVVLGLAYTYVFGRMYGFYSYYSYYGKLFILWFLGMSGAMWVFTLAAVSQMARLQEGSKRLADGDFSEPIDTRGLFWEFRMHAENINKAGDGIARAVEEQMKSERFKTELITNVSHDIKTPLTSIINYVDLLQKENPENETVREYLEVLARQSARLKKLIEDLMEASKASTGNLTVHFETCDANVLLAQIVGEFEEKTAASRLEMVVEQPGGTVPVSVDSRHIWRVFDNLLGNICKYAQPETRVYISLSCEDGDAVLQFKNISRYRLNITSEELMERFVRGDSSRNTEGSGLGLSIAQSLTALMNGTMEVFVDGDLFKVILRFPIQG